MKEDIAALKDLFGKLPANMDKMGETLTEMKKGSIPDKSADYWEEKEDINKWIAIVIEQQANLKTLRGHFDEKDKKFKDLSAAAKKTTDIPGMELLLAEITTEGAQVAQILEDTYTVDDQISEVHKEMDDCQIPVNIKMRANQIDQLREKLENLESEFSDLKQADEAYEGTSEAEREIKALIDKIQRKLSQLIGEKDAHQKYQVSKMEAYTERQILSYENAPIVKDVRQFKEKIEETIAKIGELEEFLRALNEKLISQDLNNASRLLQQQSLALRKRLEIAKAELNKISTCGEEMDGNTSHNEEEEFIDALKEEMPEVFRNIDSNFELLDTIDEMIAEVQKTKSIETMQELKNHINDAHIKIEQCEGLVNKLENEIIEWDAFKKLCRRDEELGEIENLLGEFKHDVAEEKTLLKTGKEKQDDFLSKATDEKDKKDATYLLEGIQQYTIELDALMGDVSTLNNER